MAENEESEIGRELKAAELVENTVVVVIPPPYHTALTVWVVRVSFADGIAVFRAGEHHTTILNRVDDAGRIFDGQGRTIHVFEYKGEI